MTEKAMNKAIVQACETYKDILHEYYKLSVSVSLSDQQAERMEEILQKAEEEEILNFLLTEVDYILNEKFGLFSNENIEQYKNQQAYLREYLEQAPKVLDTCRELQKELRARGFYCGPIDGIFGEVSQMALFRQLQAKSKHSVLGISDQEVYKELMRRITTLQSDGEQYE